VKKKQWNISMAKKKERKIPNKAIETALREAVSDTKEETPLSKRVKIQLARKKRLQRMRRQKLPKSLR